MKKLYTIFAAAALAMLPVCFTGCTDEPLDTNQYSAKAVKLVSFGPNPVMRGGALTFIGSNLEKIVEVQVPGVDPITEIEVVSGGLQSEIRVVLPEEGPEVGKVVLVASDGTVLTTSVDLEYSEPIVFEKFEVNTPAYPGDVVKLKGDYMNLVKSVEFSGGEKSPVDVIDRHNATTVVPATAVSGKIILSDEGEIANLIYSDTDLQIGDPTVSSVKAASWKPGQKATVTGKYLNMIKELHLEGDVTVATGEFVLAEDSKSIVFDIPALAKSGSVIAVSYAGKEFEAGKAEMVVPTELAVTPAEVRNGETVAISGKDLDVVTSITFPNASAITEFTLADGKISVSVPLEARSGDIVLGMSNGETVSAAYTIIAPTVTAVAPLALMAGETITVTGTGLNLVKSATLGGKDVQIQANEDGTELVITTENTSVSGKIVLTLQNGETLEPSEEITLSYDALIVVNEMPTAEHIGGVVTLRGENFMLIENIYIGDAKVTAYSSRSDTELSFVMPYNKVGTYPMKFVLYSGDEEICPTQIEVLLEINYITAWEGNLPITWNDGGRVIVPASKFEGVSAGTKMRFYYSYDDNTWCQAQINYGDWKGLEFPEIGSNTLVPVCSYSGKGKIEAFTEVTLTADILAAVEAKKGDCEDVKAAGIIIQGSDITFTKIEIIQEIPQEVTIWTGSWDAAGWQGNQDLAWGGYDWSQVQAGQKLIFYLTQDSSQTYWQLSLRHGQSWGELPEKVFVEMTEGQTRVEVEMTQTNLDDLVANGGMVITGCYYTLTKVALL
jgi:hypothetical protein